MTLTFNLETLFKVTEHPLPKGTLCVRYEPDWDKGREAMLQTGNLGRMDRQTDGLTDYYRAPTEGS